jgi:tRNA(His) guanylyltransferase
MEDSLGGRIKRYENVFNGKLVPKMPLFIRVDGKAFHTWTRGCEKPFDQRLVNAMVNAAIDTAKQMQGFKLGYVQSDEATFMLSDEDSYETQAWFGNELNKIVSVSASLFTAYFNREAWRFEGEGRGPAFFDSRAFNVPHGDAANVFTWRQQDWERNSVQMLARAHFSHAELMNKKIPDLHEMLFTKGVNWARLPNQLKNGTFILPGGSLVSKLSYDAVNELLSTKDVLQAPAAYPSS